MSDGSGPAYPVIPPMYPGTGDPANAYPWPAAGLTKREHFAALAMQGLLAKGAVPQMSADEYALIAKWSVAQADALIAALKK